MRTNILLNILLAWFITFKYTDIWHTGLFLNTCPGTVCLQSSVKLWSNRMVFLNLGWFCPAGEFSSVKRHFWLSQLARNVGRPTMLLTSYNVQDSHPPPHPTPHTESSCPKCQLCQGWETLHQRITWSQCGTNTSKGDRNLKLPETAGAKNSGAEFLNGMGQRCNGDTSLGWKPPN